MSRDLQRRLCGAMGFGGLVASIGLAIQLQDPVFLVYGVAVFVAAAVFTPSKTDKDNPSD